MRFQRVVLALVLSLLIPTIILATHPTPLPDRINTPNFGYSVWFTDDNPPPTPDSNYFPRAQAQRIANALDTNATPTPGTPNGYHPGYTNLGFLAPDFASGDEDVFVFDCAPHGGCDLGNAPADRINMPAPYYRNKPEACLRLVIGHELFHHVQFAYITFGKWGAWGKAPVEGTARLMQDKIYLDLDGNAGCITYLGEVNNYLANPNRTLWDIAYTTALFWNYLMEQLGTVTTEPQVGVDFIRKFWVNAQANNNSPDTVATLRQTIRDFDLNATLEGLFHDFTIANYTKQMDVSGLPDGLKYRYIDENDGRSGAYQNVSLTWNGTLPPNRGPVNNSVVRWGARYYEATVGTRCTDVVGFLAETTNDKAAAFSLVAITGTNRVERIYKSVGHRFARTLLQDPANPYTRLGAVVAGLNDDVDFRYTFACGGVDLSIIYPTSRNQAYAGDPSAPDRFLVKVRVYGPSILGSPSVEGLAPDDFVVYVGSVASANQATVLSGAYVQGDYWLVVQAPPKPSPGVFSLTVRLRTIANAVEKSAVRYEKRVMDEVVVIDRSGSMLFPVAYPKLTAARNAASLFVDAANTDDRLGVVSFGGDQTEPNDDATLHVMLQDVDNALRTTAKSAIQGLSTAPDVFTSIGDGLEKARQEFILRGQALGEDWIVLLSDGMENEALFWNDVRTNIQSANIKVQTIALGPYTDQALLQQIASQTNGTYYYVDVPTSLANRAQTDQATPTFTLDLSDAYAAAFERIRRHERLWETSGIAGTSVRAFDIPIREGGIRDGRFSIAWPDSKAPLKVEIIRPDGSIVENGVAGARVYVTKTHFVAHVDNLSPGTWRVRIVATRGPTPFIAILSGYNWQGAQMEVYFAQYHDDRALRAQRGLFLQGLPMPILVTLTDSRGPIVGAVITATVEHPDGSVLPLPLLDDGNHGDGEANDGIYGNTYTRTTVGSPTGLPDDPARVPPERGSYRVRVEATGQDNFRREFRRIRKAAFQIFRPVDQEKIDPDEDKDGMPTRYELLHPCLDPNVNDAADDPDMDDIRSGKEYVLGTNPCHPDTDQGGESDGSEIKRGSNPFDPRDDRLPRPVDVEVVDWIPDHFPPLPLQPNTNLLRFPLNQAYTYIHIYRSTNPAGPFIRIARVKKATSDGFYKDTRLVNGRTYYYYVQAEGANGAMSAPSHIFSGTPKSDPFPPMGEVWINDGHAYVETPWVTLSLTADSDVTHMMVSNSADFTSASWEPFTTTKSWRLEPGANGFATVYVKFRDRAGNVSRIYHDTIEVTGEGTLGAIRLFLFWQPLSFPFPRTMNRLLQEPVEGAFVTATNAPEAPGAFSDAKGTVLLSPLRPGNYDILVEHTGFTPETLRGVKVGPGEVTEIGEVELHPQRFTGYIPLLWK